MPNLRFAVENILAKDAEECTVQEIEVKFAYELGRLEGHQKAILDQTNAFKEATRASNAV